ncbi:MAG TPA: DUF748 domain-containing protein [Methylomirabilota bacterium]
MNRRALVWLASVFVLCIVLVALAIPALPQILRIIAINRIQAATGRATSIDAVALDLRSGRLLVTGLKLADRDGSPLGSIQRFEARVRLRELLRGHLHIRDLTITDSTVHVVRFSHDEFNISDLIKRQGGDRRPLAVTVDRFALARGTVLLEDRSISPWRVWKSEDVTIDARNVSTRRDDGEANGSTTVNGSPITVRVEHLRLAPVHLNAVVRAQRVDMSLARVYLPPDTPVILDRGQLDTTITAVVDARDGLRVDVDGQIADAVVIRRFQKDPVVTAPLLRVAVREFTVGANGELRVGRVELGGATTLINADATPPARFELARLSVRAEKLAWPVREPAWLEVASAVPGGGELTMRGRVNVKPVSAQLDVRLTRVNLSPWAHYAAPGLSIKGTGEAAVSVDLALQPRLTAVGKGTAQVTGVAVADGDRRLLDLDRAEVAGLDVQWPSRVTVGRVTLRGPVALVERDASGALVLPTLTGEKHPTAKRGATKGAGDEEADAPPPAPPPSITVAVGEVAVERGALRWRDASVKPNTDLRVADVRLLVKDVAWPLKHAVPVDLRFTAPAGGTVAVKGDVGIDPMAADVQVTARGVAVGPYRAYLPGALPVRGRADATVAATIDRTTALQARVRGDAALTGLFLSDARRKIVTVERAEARGLDVEWPGRISADRVTLRQPWVLVERDEKGGFPLLATLREAGAKSDAVATATPGPGSGTEAALPREAALGAAPVPAESARGTGADGPTRALGDGNGRPALAVAVREFAIQDGGARVIDRTLTPVYTDDLSRLWLRVRGFSTAPADPAHVDLRATLGPAAPVIVRGTVSALGAPLDVDVTAELRDLAVTRLNAYLRHFIGWNASNGRVSARVSGRVRGDELEAETAVQLGRLQVVRGDRDDAAQRHLGLPLGVLVGLLKDRRGNINVSLPVGGRLSDPRFDFKDAMWSAGRAVAVKTIALPVSWIGRLRFSADSKVQDVEIDPVGFEAGTATPTAEGTARLQRVAGFMDSLPDVRMVVTPVVSLGDIEKLKTDAIAARIKTAVTESRVTELEAAQRLFVQQFPRQDPPVSLGALISALREVEPPPAREAAALARQRADAVRDTLKKAGIDPARITPSRDAGALESFDAGQVEFELTDQLKPRRSLLEMLKALLESLQRKLEASRPASVAAER